MLHRDSFHHLSKLTLKSFANQLLTSFVAGEADRRGPCISAYLSTILLLHMMLIVHADSRDSCDVDITLLTVNY